MNEYYQIQKKLEQYGEEYRICTNCGSMMQEGYCICDGLEYFCSDDCLYGYYSEEEYISLCEQDEAYWTQWD